MFRGSKVQSDKENVVSFYGWRNEDFICDFDVHLKIEYKNIDNNLSSHLRFVLFHLQGPSHPLYVNAHTYSLQTFGKDTTLSSKEIKVNLIKLYK